MVSEKYIVHSPVNSQKVLILVVVEDGLGVRQKYPDLTEENSLNPCCSGRWSRRNVVRTKQISVSMS